MAVACDGRKNASPRSPSRSASISLAASAASVLPMPIGASSMISPGFCVSAAMRWISVCIALGCSKPNLALHKSSYRHSSLSCHGTDRALVAGALGMREDDDRLPNAFAIAAERGLKYSFSEEEMRDVHENTVRMTFNMTDGSVQTVTGSSIGGGQILITSINGFDVEYTAQSNAIIIAQYDRKGVISHVTGALAEHDINIGVMRLSRRARGDIACTIIEVDAHISPNIVAELRALPDIISVRAINVQ